MKVYVCYLDLGYDGCIEPEKVFKKKSMAESWARMHTTRYEKGRYVELELE